MAHIFASPLLFKTRPLADTRCGLYLQKTEAAWSAFFDSMYGHFKEVQVSPHFVDGAAIVVKPAHYTALQKQALDKGRSLWAGVGVNKIQEAAKAKNKKEQQEQAQARERQQQQQMARQQQPERQRRQQQQPSASTGLMTAAGRQAVADSGDAAADGTGAGGAAGGSGSGAGDDAGGSGSGSGTGSGSSGEAAAAAGQANEPPRTGTQFDGVSQRFLVQPFVHHYNPGVGVARPAFVHTCIPPIRPSALPPTVSRCLECLSIQKTGGELWQWPRGFRPTRK